MLRTTAFTQPGTLTFGASKRIQQSIVDQLYFIRKTMRTLDKDAAQFGSFSKGGGGVGGAAGAAHPTTATAADDEALQYMLQERLCKISQVIDIAESTQID